MTTSVLEKFQVIRLWIWLSKVSFTTVVLTDSEFQRRFPKYFWFHTLFKRWVIKKFKLYESSLLHIFYYILEYTIISILTKCFDVMVAATLGKNLGLPMSKQWLMSSRRPRVIGNMQFFVTCQNDVVNKQLFFPFSWNNSLPKTALGESYTNDWQACGCQGKTLFGCWGSL